MKSRALSLCPSPSTMPRWAAALHFVIPIAPPPEKIRGNDSRSPLPAPAELLLRGLQRQPRIAHLCSIPLGPWMQAEWLDLGGTCNLSHFNIARQQGIGDERAMASPWNSLRTHHGDLLQPCHFNKVVDLSCKFRSLHVIGVSSEAQIAPAQVRHRAFAGMTKAAKSGHVCVTQMFALQRLGERVALVLRVVA